MPGKRVQFDDQTWQAIDAAMSRDGLSFQELADEAFKDVLKKHNQPDQIKANKEQPEEAEDHLKPP